jgi:hypothetical protein
VGDGELGRALLLILRADAVASSGEFLTIREFGAIGNGVSFAMGVAARPDRTVVLFDGDGSLMMHVGARNHQAPRTEHPDRGDERRRLRFRVHKLRSEGMREMERCSATAISRASRVDSGFGKTTGSDDLPSSWLNCWSGGAAVWDFRPDKVVSPTIRRAHPHRA